VHRYEAVWDVLTFRKSLLVCSERRTPMDGRAQDLRAWTTVILSLSNLPTC